MITLRPLQTGMYCMAEKTYCCLARIEGDVIFAPDQHQIYEIIDTPPHPERDLHDAPHLILDRVRNYFANNSYYSYDDFKKDIIKILQQADKPAPIKRKVKGWANIYSDGSGSIHYNKETADFKAEKNRIACKEIEIECYENEGLNG